ncbi:RagB/SusD family nutrient uptake outer membrane protein [Chitinophaga sp. YIM B06452]|uniref:RagB/SusD family nutrient uptake outer membrane protein n=1 Tax=Chitinophaga sp. YIM B06452 TaxID=3082158 RepID=UPI0031FE6618
MKPIIYCGITLLLLAGCDKFVDVPLPISQLSTEATFADNEKAGSAIRGIYASTQNGFGPGPFSGTLSGNAGLSADELIKISYNADQEAFQQNNLTPATSPVGGALWGAFYYYIYQANAAIENLEKSKGVTADKKVQFIGEAKFIRALSYFYLVNLYGPAPLATTSDYRVNALLPRADTGKLWQLIEEDLRYAITNTGTDFTTKGARSRASRYSSAALLARVQLYRKNWADAEALATDVISSNLYTLDTLDGMFLTTSPEPIFYFSPAGTNNYTTEGSQVHNITSLPYRLSPYLLAAFEPGDQRRVKWVRENADGKPSANKYKIFSGTGSTRKEGTAVLRAAEQYLIRAEARTQRDNLSGAIADLDVIRHRAGLPLIANTNPSISKTALLDTILHERFVEFFGEFGHRWMDVIRTGNTTKIFGVNKPGWEKDDVLYPVPAGERELNPNLSQNDGY